MTEYHSLIHYTLKWRHLIVRQWLIHRGYYTVARRYEFYFRVAKQYCFCREKIKFISSSRRVMFFLLYRHADDVVFDDFRRFPTTFRRFPKISKIVPKARRTFPNIFRKFPKISENVRRCPKISDDCRRLSRKTRRCFDDTPTN